MPRSSAGPPFVLAAAAFAALWLLFSQTAPIWHESITVYPEPAVPMLAEPTAENPGPTFLPSCADAGPTRLVVTNMRPQVALCFWGRQYPLQIMSYASGVPYWVSDLFWPIHRGRVFWLRAAGLFLGLLTLVVVRRLLTRFADPTTANMAALCVGVSPGFLWTYSSLLHYEVLPWLACAGALYQLSWCPALAPGASRTDAPPPTGRVAAAAALLGLTLLANFKAVFLIAPLAAMALRAGVRFSAIRAKQWALALPVFIAVLSPTLLGNTVNAGADLTHQLLMRSKTVVAHLNPMAIAAEIPNLAVFWGDTLAYLPLISGDPIQLSIPGLLVAAVGISYCLPAGVLYLLRGRGRVVPAACGLMMLTFVLVSALLYDFVASGNYIPLTAVFGMATGATATDGARWIASRFRWPVGRTLAAAAVAIVAAMIFSAVGHGTPAHRTTISINAVAERELGDYLTAHAEPDVPLLVTTYILTGVPEAVTGGAVRTIKAHPYLTCGQGRGTLARLDQATVEQGRSCLRARFKRLLNAFPGSTRLLLPLKGSPIDDTFAGELGSSLEAAAASEGRTIREEAAFSGWGTGPVMRLVRVDAVTKRQ